VKKPEEEILKKASELGFKYQKEYTGCCQCVLAAIQDTLGMKNEAAFKAATGLSGGLGLTGAGSCGALIGGIMAISSKIGRDRENFKDPEGIRWQTYELTKKLYNRFVKEYGSGNCREIQKKLFGRSYNLWDATEHEEFKEAGGYTEKCPLVVGKAARWAAEILLEL